jgi:transposase
MNDPASQDFPVPLLPSVPLRVESVVIDANLITVTARSLQASGACPLCHTPSTRLHSRYRRTLRDLPWGPLPVRLVVRVRRFRCALRTCRRRVFTERMPALATPHARSTARFRRSLRDVGFALGGKPGSRLAHQLRLPGSASTLLRSLPVPPPMPPALPRVVGVDDFAKRRGKSYGTIVVDLERRRPLALLEDRTAPTLAAWLKDQPQLEVVCSDRSTEYARGIALGAPQATAVADRWHLLKNLREALERLLDHHQRELRDITLPVVRREGDVGTAEKAGTSTRLPAKRSLRERAVRQGRRERRRARFEAVRAMRAEGVSLAAIARHFGLSRTTVARYVQADAFPDWAAHPERPGILDPFEAHLRRRWDEGCHSGLELLREIQAQGYRGSHKPVARWARAHREAPARTTPTKYLADRAAPSEVTEADPAGRPSARRLSWLLVRDPERLDDAGARALARMRESCPAVATAYPLAQQFGRMVRERQAPAFVPWLDAASESGVSELRTFAAGLRRDQPAVEAALTLAWSNGQTEGQVTRLKLIKRQGFGRGSLDLLRRRTIGAA